jgi:hypothetical protein
MAKPTSKPDDNREKLANGASYIKLSVKHWQETDVWLSVNDTRLHVLRYQAIKTTSGSILQALKCFSIRGEISV